MLDGQFPTIVGQSCSVAQRLQPNIRGRFDMTLEKTNLPFLNVLSIFEDGRGVQLDMAPDSFVDSNEVPEARICSGEDKGRKI